MTKYQSKKHPEVFITTDGVVDPKFNTIFIKFEDGKIQQLSMSTIKRWWIPVGETEEVETPVEETPVDTSNTTVETPIEVKVDNSTETTKKTRKTDSTKSEKSSLDKVEDTLNSMDIPCHRTKRYLRVNKMKVWNLKNSVRIFVESFDNIPSSIYTKKTVTSEGLSVYVPIENVREFFTTVID